jgi:hypothetical protein
MPSIQVDIPSSLLNLHLSKYSVNISVCLEGDMGGPGGDRETTISPPSAPSHAPPSPTPAPPAPSAPTTPPTPPTAPTPPAAPAPAAPATALVPTVAPAPIAARPSSVLTTINDTNVAYVLPSASTDAGNCSDSDSSHSATCGGVERAIFSHSEDYLACSPYAVPPAYSSQG